MIKLNDIKIVGIRFQVSDNVSNVIQFKCEKLLKHQKLINGLRFELQKNFCSSKNDYNYIATGHMEIKGRTSVFHAESDSVYKSIDDLINKLDRSIRRDARAIKKQRKHDSNSNLDLTI